LPLAAGQPGKACAVPEASTTDWQSPAPSPLTKLSPSATAAVRVRFRFRFRVNVPAARRFSCRVAFSVPPRRSFDHQHWTFASERQKLHGFDRNI
jgi:hypothetical protein